MPDFHVHAGSSRRFRPGFLSLAHSCVLCLVVCHTISKPASVWPMGATFDDSVDSPDDSLMQPASLVFSLANWADRGRAPHSRHAATAAARSVGLPRRTVTFTCSSKLFSLICFLCTQGKSGTRLVAHRHHTLPWACRALLGL